MFKHVVELFAAILVSLPQNEYQLSSQLIQGPWTGRFFVDRDARTLAAFPPAANQKSPWGLCNVRLPGTRISLSSFKRHALPIVTKFAEVAPIGYLSRSDRLLLFSSDVEALVGATDQAKNEWSLSKTPGVSSLLVSENEKFVIIRGQPTTTSEGRVVSGGKLIDADSGKLLFDWSGLPYSNFLKDNSSTFMVYLTESKEAKLIRLPEAREILSMPATSISEGGYLFCLPRKSLVHLPTGRATSFKSPIFGTSSSALFCTSESLLVSDNMGDIAYFSADSEQAIWNSTLPTPRSRIIDTWRIGKTQVLHFHEWFRKSRLIAFSVESGARNWSVSFSSELIPVGASSVRNIDGGSICVFLNPGIKLESKDVIGPCILWIDAKSGALRKREQIEGIGTESFEVGISAIVKHTGGPLAGIWLVRPGGLSKFILLDMEEERILFSDNERVSQVEVFENYCVLAIVRDDYAGCDF